MAELRLVTNRQESVFNAGFREEWISGQGQGDNVSFELCKSVMNTLIVLKVEVDGKTVYETADMTSLLTDWVNSVVKEVRA